MANWREHEGFPYRGVTTEHSGTPTSILKTSPSVPTQKGGTFFEDIIETATEQAPFRDASEEQNQVPSDKNASWWDRQDWDGFDTEWGGLPDWLGRIF